MAYIFIRGRDIACAVTVSSIDLVLQSQTVSGEAQGLKMFVVSNQVVSNFREE